MAFRPSPHEAPGHPGIEDVVQVVEQVLRHHDRAVDGHGLCCPVGWSSLLCSVMLHEQTSYSTLV